MKKEINSKSRRKWIMGGLAAFASVALLTTGFAVWVIGANKTVDKGDVGVTVDTAQNNSIVFNFNLDSNDTKIELKESGEKKGNMINTDGVTDGNPLSISYTGATIKFGANYNFNFKSIVFSIEDPSEMKGTNGEAASDADDYASVKISGNGALTGEYARTEGDYTYLEAPKAIAIPTYTKATSGTTTISLPAGTLDFCWGSFFGGNNTSPADFYNEKFKNADSNTVANHTDEVQKEYDDLTVAFAKEFDEDGKTVKTWKKLKLVATLSTDDVAAA